MEFIVTAMTESGGGWVDSAPIRAQADELGITNYMLKAACRHLGVERMREGRRESHRMLWLLAVDRKRETRLPDGRLLTTEIFPGETGDAMAHRHRESYRALTVRAWPTREAA
jgi:hypothetical protein